MEIIILGHIIGDFYVQTNKTADKKKTSMKYMLIHCLVYTIVLGIGFYILNRQIVKMLIISCIIYLSHLIIDLVKTKCTKKYKNYEYIIFLIDQAIHIVVLFVIIYIVKNLFGFRMNDNFTINGLNVKHFIIMATEILICWRPTAIFISLVFNMIPETIEQADESMNISKNIENESLKIGTWIGILEREIILILGLMGQFGAIGFVLTAKSLARFKQLENKSFSEKYLVGTLLSAFIAIVCIAVYRIMLDL
jgi:hypothetical protein